MPRKRLEEGIDEIRKAAQVGSDDPRYTYALGIALKSAKRDAEALGVLERASARFPGHREILFALATIDRQRGARAEALAWARRLMTLTPSDPAAQRLLADLQSEMDAERLQRTSSTSHSPAGR